MFHWRNELRPKFGGGDTIGGSFFAVRHAGSLVPAGVSYQASGSFPGSLRSACAGAEHAVSCGAAARRSKP